MGIDYAAAAIERARAVSPDQPGKLEWRVVDILKDPAPRTDFDVLLDRGCLHRIPRRFWRQYAEKVRMCGQPGTKLWLLIATFDHAELTMLDTRMTPAEIKRTVTHAFEPFFKIDRDEQTAFELPDNDCMDAVAFWMTARP